MKAESGACAYVVTAHKSTAVTHSAVGNFTHENDLNLIVAKLTRIEVNISSDIGLKPVKEFNLYGKIAVMELFRYKVFYIQNFMFYNYYNYKTLVYLNFLRKFFKSKITTVRL